MVCREQHAPINQETSQAMNTKLLQSSLCSGMMKKFGRRNRADYTMINSDQELTLDRASAVQQQTLVAGTPKTVVKAGVTARFRPCSEEALLVGRALLSSACTAHT